MLLAVVKSQRKSRQSSVGSRHRLSSRLNSYLRFQRIRLRRLREGSLYWTGEPNVIRRWFNDDESASEGSSCDSNEVHDTDLTSDLCLQGRHSGAMANSGNEGEAVVDKLGASERYSISERNCIDGEGRDELRLTIGAAFSDGLGGKGKRDTRLNHTFGRVQLSKSRAETGKLQTIEGMGTREMIGVDAPVADLLALWCPLPTSAVDYSEDIMGRWLAGTSMSGTH